MVLSFEEAFEVEFASLHRYLRRGGVLPRVWHCQERQNLRVRAAPRDISRLGVSCTHPRAARAAVRKDGQHREPLPVYWAQKRGTAR